MSLLPEQLSRFLRSSLNAEMSVGGKDHQEHARWLRQHPELAGVFLGQVAGAAAERLPENLGKSALHDITTFHTGTLTWASLGFPVFNLTADFFKAILVTDFGDVGEEVMQLPFPAFVVRCPEDLYPGTRNLFIYPLDHKSTDFAQLVPGDGLVFRMTLEQNPHVPSMARSEHGQAYTQWPQGLSFEKFLRGPVKPIEQLSKVEATASKEMGTTIDPNATAIARRVLGNLLLYINANGGALPREKAVRGAPPAGVEKEHATEPRYRVGRPVKLGPQLRAALANSADRSASSGWKLAQRHIVRGHWRNQVHGPGRALRRRQWIQPFWKGPADVNEAFTRTFEVE